MIGRTLIKSTLTNPIIVLDVLLEQVQVRIKGTNGRRKIEGRRERDGRSLIKFTLTNPIIVLDHFAGTNKCRYAVECGE